MIQSKRKLLALLIGIFAIQLLSQIAATAAPRAKYVFIISFDQGNPDLIQRTEMPTFHSMATNGAHTWEAYTSSHH